MQFLKNSLILCSLFSAISLFAAQPKEKETAELQMTDEHVARTVIGFFNATRLKKFPPSDNTAEQIEQNFNAALWRTLSLYKRSGMSLDMILNIKEKPDETTILNLNNTLLEECTKEKIVKTLHANLYFAYLNLVQQPANDPNSFSFDKFHRYIDENERKADDAALTPLALLIDALRSREEDLQTKLLHGDINLNQNLYTLTDKYGVKISDIANVNGKIFMPKTEFHQKLDAQQPENPDQTRQSLKQLKLRKKLAKQKLDKLAKEAQTAAELKSKSNTSKASKKGTTAKSTSVVISSAAITQTPSNTAASDSATAAAKKPNRKQRKRALDKQMKSANTTQNAAASTKISSANDQVDGSSALDSDKKLTNEILDYIRSQAITPSDTARDVIVGYLEDDFIAQKICTIIGAPNQILALPGNKFAVLLEKENCKELQAVEIWNIEDSSTPIKTMLLNISYPRLSLISKRRLIANQDSNMYSRNNNPCRIIHLDSLVTTESDQRILGRTPQGLQIVLPKDRTQDELHIVDPETGEVKNKIPVGHTIYKVKVMPDGKIIGVGYQTIKIWKPQRSDAPYTTIKIDEIYHVDDHFETIQNSILVADEKEIRQYSADTGKLQKKYPFNNKKMKTSSIQTISDTQFCMHEYSGNIHVWNINDTIPSIIETGYNLVGRIGMWQNGEFLVAANNQSEKERSDDQAKMFIEKHYDRLPPYDILHFKPSPLAIALKDIKKAKANSASTALTVAQTVSAVNTAAHNPHATAAEGSKK